MSNTRSDHPYLQPSRALAARLQRWATRLIAPRPAAKGRVLPEELEGAEDWLLDDLGLAEPENDVAPRTCRNRPQ